MTKFMVIFDRQAQAWGVEYKILEAKSGQDARKTARDLWRSLYDEVPMRHIYIGAVLYEDPHHKWGQDLLKEQENEKQAREEQERISQEMVVAKKTQEEYGYSGYKNRQPPEPMKIPKKRA